MWDRLKENNEKRLSVMLHPCLSLCFTLNMFFKKLNIIRLIAFVSIHISLSFTQMFSTAPDFYVDKGERLETEYIAIVFG